jgi:hypothetical protein
MNEPTNQSTPKTRLCERIDEQFAQHEDVYLRNASDLDRNRLWRLRETMLRLVNEELADELSQEQSDA